MTVNQDSQQAATTSQTDKLYAGKYKTVEELEEGYKNSSRSMTLAKELEAKLQEATKVPDDYLLPNGVELAEHEISDIKSLAKSTGLTQANFDKLALETTNRNKAKALKVEEAKKSLGQEKLNILTDYVKNHYPDKIADVVLSNIIVNQDLLNVALNHRNQLLNSSVPGTRTVSAGGYSITYDDVLKARQEIDKAPAHKRKELENNYIRLSSEYARNKKSK